MITSLCFRLITCKRWETQSEDDVIREAIDSSLEKRQQGQRRLRQMVQDAEAEIATGFVGAFNADATKDAVRQRLLQNGVRP